MKKLLTLSLALGFAASGAMAKSTATSTAARTAQMTAVTATMAASNQAALNTQTAMSFANPSLAEVEGMGGCDIDRADEKSRDAFNIKSDPLANLAWAAEKATNFGGNFEDAPITPNQLMMIRAVQSRSAVKGSTLEWLSVHETLVLCESSFKLLDKNVVEGRW